MTPKTRREHSSPRASQHSGVVAMKSGMTRTHEIELSWNPKSRGRHSSQLRFQTSHHRTRDAWSSSAPRSTSTRSSSNAASQELHVPINGAFVGRSIDRAPSHVPNEFVTGPESTHLTRERVDFPSVRSETDSAAAQWRGDVVIGVAHAGLSTSMMFGEPPASFDGWRS